jgi:predicted nucleic acid-binding protein
MTCIIDNSWAAAYFMSDEDVPEVIDFFEHLKAEDRILIPVLFWVEYNNVLKTGIRRKRITKAQAGQALDDFSSYRFETIAEYGLDFSKRVLDVACQYDLSSYDATYLELALRKNAALATLDDRLKAAAVKAGVEVK